MDQDTGRRVAATTQPLDATATLQVTTSRLEASLILSPPQNGGADITLWLLKDTLQKKGVVFGIDNEVLQELAHNPVYDKPIVVARGQESVPGKAAELTYFINTQKDLRPKERPDGSVDFKDLGIVELVKKGDLLCEKTPPTPGVDGATVMGMTIPAHPGKDINLPRGRGTVPSEDQRQLYADIDGQADIIDNKICVLDTFTVDGDVCPATGDINFVGNVSISGGVIQGFAVQATGNIDVWGVVESADIVAGGSIIIRGGCLNANLDAGSDVTCRFVQNGKINLGGNLETTYVLNSTINCGGSVNLTGKGLIMGGHVSARRSIMANALGGANATTDTIVEVGNDPELVRRYQDTGKQLEECLANMRKVEELVKTLLQVKNAGRLTQDKAETLAKSAMYLKQLKESRIDLENQRDALKLQISSLQGGSIRVRRTAYPGVKIIIGTEQISLQSEYSFTSFTRERKGIAFHPLR